MKIISWNVNGIRACARKGFLEWLNKESPDILCLQETKAFPEQLEKNILSPAGYVSYWNNPNRKGYAGVAVFTKREPAHVIKDFGDDVFDTEGRALILDYKKFLIINVYFPNGGTNESRLRYKLKFYDKFLSYLNSLGNRGIILCGDVNTAHKEIDLARPKENEYVSGFLPEERAWVDNLISYGYIDTFRFFNKDAGHYTWWDYKTYSRERNIGWRIDYFFINEELKQRLQSSFIMRDSIGSDHAPVGIEIAL
ncbi:exodeoxyribonuclease III [Candidatus Omnitrophus magneticus]|uniref:Exodeoxyribonuclease III n=1 Tax=Candidatus Omnitrophus magneticus TaxID=1609969 RepID=A0A0F0CLM4_9BACT|nr:exodeoxyribonuclease III [Candidatus Omnitrophus magneticus]